LLCVSKNTTKKHLNQINSYIMNSMGRCGSTLLFDFVRGYYEQGGFLIDLKNLSDKQELHSRRNSSDWTVWKTHDPHPPQEKLPGIKFIYQFANPLDVVLSTVHMKNLVVHLRHLGAHNTFRNHTDLWGTTLKPPADPFTRARAALGQIRIAGVRRRGWEHDIVYDKTKNEPTGNLPIWARADVLGLEKHFDNWAHHNQNHILFIKYEDMWDNLDKICEYFELPAEYKKSFPQKKERKYNHEDINPNLRELLMKTYGNLYEKIESFDGVKEFFP